MTTMNAKQPLMLALGLATTRELSRGLLLLVSMALSLCTFPIHIHDLSSSFRCACSSPGSNEQYSKSWTEEHLAEQDYLKKVLEKTQQYCIYLFPAIVLTLSGMNRNLIDVTQEPAILEEKEIEERLNRYTQHIKIDKASMRKNLADLVSKLSAPEGNAEESGVRLASESESELVSSFSCLCCLLTVFAQSKLAAEHISEALTHHFDKNPLLVDLVVTVDRLEA